MRLPSPPQLLLPLLLLLGPVGAAAAGAWGFDDASVAVVAKKSDEAANKITFSIDRPATAPLTLPAGQTLKVRLTATDNNKPSRPHQAMLLLQEPDSGLETAFPFKVNPKGEATVDVAHKDLPVQLLLSASPLQAVIVIGSFGKSRASLHPAFAVAVELDPSSPSPVHEKPVRYGRRDEIHHIFRPDAKSPPVVVSIFFTVLVLAALPVLLVGWIALGANVSSLPQAFAAAPISNPVFFGSIIAMEASFFLYYGGMRLFEILPVTGLIGLVSFMSGMRALGEMQGRRRASQKAGGSEI